MVGLDFAVGLDHVAVGLDFLAGLVFAVELEFGTFLATLWRHFLYTFLGVRTGFCYGFGHCCELGLCSGPQK